MEEVVLSLCLGNKRSDVNVQKIARIRSVLLELEPACIMYDEDQVTG